MDAAEVSAVAKVHTEPLFQLMVHLIRLPLQLLCSVFRQLRHGRLSGVPVMCPVLIKKRSLLSEASQGVAENRGGFSRHNAAQPHPPVLDAAMCSSCSRRRPEVDGPRDTPAGCKLAKVW